MNYLCDVIPTVSIDTIGTLVIEFTVRDCTKYTIYCHTDTLNNIISYEVSDYNIMNNTTRFLSIGFYSYTWQEIKEYFNELDINIMLELKEVNHD